MASKKRLDVLLTERGMAESRQKAQAIIMAGQVYVNGQKVDKAGWEDVAYLLQEYDVSWTAEAWLIRKESTTEWEVNWEWLYGKLPAGTYRLVKGFTDFRESGDYNNFAYWTEFEIK